MERKTVIRNISYQLDDGTLSGLAIGVDTQPIVLCLHGWLDNAASFIPLMNVLDGYHVISIDWPGHGLSSHRSADAHYHFIDYVHDLLLLFEHNQWPAIHIVAHSMGGMIASAFAAAFPEKVKTLTLIDSIGFISARSEHTTQQLRSGLLSRLAIKEKRKPQHPNIESAISARRKVSDLSYKDAKLIVERGCVDTHQGITWRSDSRLRNTSPYRLTFSQAAQFIKDIQTPTQLIYGDNGIELVEKGLVHFAPLFNQLTLIKLVGGHHIHMEQAQESASHIKQFIKNFDDIG